jgi:hypothetical protein
MGGSQVAQSPTREKSYAFALRIIDFVKHVQQEKKEYVLTRQALGSGTSIGANAEEAAAGLSRKDFAAKLSIASKEARAGSLLVDCEELIRMLTSSVKSLQESEAKSESHAANSKLTTHNS